MTTGARDCCFGVSRNNRIFLEKKLEQLSKTRTRNSKQFYNIFKQYIVFTMSLLSLLDAARIVEQRENKGNHYLIY